MKNLTEGKTLKLIIALAIPMLIGNIFQQVYSVVDTIIVGKYLGEEALAGVGATGTLTFVLLCFVFGLGTGAGLIVAQAFGQQAFDQMQKTISALVTTAFLFSVVVSVVGFVFCRPLLTLLSVPDNVIDYSVSYLKIIFLFVYANVAYNAASGILRSLGDTKTPLYALIISCLTNIILDLTFILIFDLGVAGAAYATVISQFLSAVFCILELFKNKEKLHLNGMSFKPKKTYVVKIMQTGFPSAFQSCMISLGGLSVQRLINSYGSSVMAGYTAACKVDSITIQIVISVCTALSIFTGQNIGCNRMDRIKEALYQTLACMIAVCIGLAVFIPMFRYQLMNIFLDSQDSGQAIEIGALYLSIIGIAYIICGIMNTYLNVLKGAGDVNTCMVAGLTELAGRIIFAYSLSYLIGVKGIWLATPISWGCGCIIPVVRYYTGKWKTKKLL